MAKPKAKKQAKKGKPFFWGLPWFAWLAIALGIVAIVAFARTYPSSEPVNPNNSGQPTAAIIDQLSAFGHPNQELIEEITGDLQSYGFQVDLYQGDEVTVDLYRSLPKQGYKLIIFRAHSGLVQAEGQPIKTSLFTNEPYSKTKYVKEQLNEELLEARVAEGYPFYFAIDSKFITESMKGNFDNTFIIVNGCSCFYLDDLAQAFIGKGASSYLAWNRTVDVDYVDNATAYLVRQLCGGKVTIEEAVTNTMNIIGPDPKYKAVLKYYPPQSGDSTLKELVQLEPDISVDPAAKNFDSINVSSSISPQTFNVSNVGYADLVVGTINITGTNANQFAIQNDNVSNKTIIPGGSASLQVVFTPTSTGAKSATLNIPSNDPAEATVLVSLSGSGVAEGAAIPPTPANFSVTSLDLSNEQVEPGQEVLVTVNVTNIGGCEGSYALNLTINGAVEQTKTVTLAPLASDTVTFTVIKEEPGSYTLSVDGLTKEFSVAESIVAAPSWLSRYWWTILIGLVVVGLLLFFFRWWRPKKALS